MMLEPPAHATGFSVVPVVVPCGHVVFEKCSPYPVRKLTPTLITAVASWPLASRAWTLTVRVGSSSGFRLASMTPGLAGSTVKELLEIWLGTAKRLGSDDAIV